MPWFGPFPSWLDQWIANMEEQPYDYKIFTSLPSFQKRVKEKLGVDCNIKPGTGKVWDYRPAFGELFAEEIKGYEYWGHTDFDCVYGDTTKYWPTDGFDVWSNHSDYVCGAWTIYRNNPFVNSAYRFCDWGRYLSDTEANGWAEKDFSRQLEKMNLVKYTLYQNKDWNDMSKLKYENGKLYDGDEEIMMAHFRRTKIYPVCITPTP